MKFLIAIKNKENESRNVLEIGCKIAEGFSADLTICYVGKKSQALIEGDVNLARKSLTEWNIYHPGLEVLEWAFDILKSKGFAGDVAFNVNNLVENSGRIHMVLPKAKHYQIRSSTEVIHDHEIQIQSFSAYRLLLMKPLLFAHSQYLAQ